MLRIRTLRRWLSENGLHLRVMFGVVIPIVIVIGVFSVIDYTRRRETAIATVSMFSTHIGQVIQSDLRHQMIESDFDGIQELIVTVGALDEVHGVYLLDTQGEIIFASDETLIGATMKSNQPECMSCHDFEVVERPNSMVIELPGGERVFRSAQVINNEPVCRDCHEEPTEHLGVLLTDLSFAPYEATIVRDLREHFLWWTAALILTLAVVGLVFNRFVLVRLNTLGRQIIRFGTSEDKVRFPDRPPDEIGRIAAALNQMAESVEEREADNAQLSFDLRRQSEQRGQLLNRLIDAQETERKRVARDLHDDLGQSLSGLSLHAQALRRLIPEDTAAAQAQVDRIEELVRETTEKMYTMILDLRPSVLDDLGLVPALRNFAERLFDPAGIRFSIRAEGAVNRAPPGIETAFYRTFQEALTNVVRHAEASLVEITLTRKNGLIIGEIVDDGRGFDVDSIDGTGDSSRGLGLLGMRERVLQYGGEIEILTRPGAGTLVRVQMELNAETDG